MQPPHSYYPFFNVQYRHQQGTIFFSTLRIPMLISSTKTTFSLTFRIKAPHWQHNHLVFSSWPGNPRISYVPLKARLPQESAGKPISSWNHRPPILNTPEQPLSSSIAYFSTFPLATFHTCSSTFCQANSLRNSKQLHYQFSVEI